MEKIRLKFTKNGPIRFIGHLDLMRYFQKCNRRAEINVKYSEGYSPHQIMSFAEPLSVGATSDGEYIDIQLDSPVDLNKMKDDLNNVMNEGVKITAIEHLDEHSQKAMTMVDAAEWILTFRNGKEPCKDWENMLMKYIDSDKLMAVKKSKKGEVEIDMKPFIYRFEIVDRDKLQGFSNKNYRYEDNSLSKDCKCIHMLISSGSRDHLKPGLIIENFYKSLGIEMPDFVYKIHRVDTYLSESDDKGTYEIPMIAESCEKIYIN